MLEVEEQVRLTNPTPQNRGSTEAGLTIAVVALMTGTTTRALRYYESIGLLSPRRNAGGIRVYDAIETRHANDIVHLRRLGFPVHDVAIYLGRQTTETNEREGLLQSLKNRLTVHTAEREFLTEAIRELSGGAVSPALARR
jgi:DNA-binding transcriptional MerR regulator